MLNPILSQLKDHPVFLNLREDELSTLDHIVDRVVFEHGDIVFDSSRAPNFLFYIESGEFSIHLPNNEIKTLKPGRLMGEIGVINNDFRSGTVMSLGQSSVIRICGTSLFKQEFVDPIIALKIVRALSKQITSYLRSDQQVSTKELIANGENDHIEFKSSIRWNLYTKQRDKAIEFAIIKTLAAFMNTDGGTLLVGVSDEGNILGLDQDEFENNDKLLLHVTGLIKNKIGSLFLKFIHVAIESISDKEVLRINCLPGSKPAYVIDGSNEYFFIRTGPATTSVRLSKMMEYIHERFNYKTLQKETEVLPVGQ